MEGLQEFKTEEPYKTQITEPPAIELGAGPTYDEDQVELARLGKKQALQVLFSATTSATRAESL